MLINKIKNLSENNKNILSNIVGAVAVKGLALIVSLYTMPAYLKFFHNEEVLGLWFTILSVLNWILNFDLGIGNGLRNKLTASLTSGDASESKKYISSAYISVGALCAVLSVAFFVVFDFINWNKVLNISTDIVSEEALLLTVKIVFIGIVLQLFFKLITSVLYALQKSSVNNALSLVTSVLTLLAVVVIPSASNEQNMICMAVVHVLAVIIPLIIASVICFCGKKLRKSIPSFRFFSKKHMSSVLGLGGAFLLVQLLYMVVMNTNEYLITLLHGNAAVTDYQIYNKLFSLGSMVFSLAMTPIWSAVTKALAERNFFWIKKLYKRLLLFAGMCSSALFLIVPLSQVLFNIWLAENTIIANRSYALAFASSGALMIFSSCFSSIANGFGKLNTQIICYGIGAFLKVLLAVILVKTIGSWIGVVWANVFAMSVYCVAQPLVINKLLKGIIAEEKINDRR